MAIYQKSYRRETTEAIEFLKGAFLITPHDTDELERVTRGISFASAGDLHVVTQDGDNVIIPSGALAAGVIHPLAVVRVIDATTTATGIVGYGEVS